MLREDHDPRDHRREHPDHQPDRHRLSERSAHQQRELHVTHSHPRGIRQRRGEQEPGSAGRAERPLGTQRQRGVRDEHDDRSRQNDSVRDDAVFDVDRRHGDEDGAEERRNCTLRRRAEREDAARHEQRSDELDRRVHPPDLRGAVPALPAQHEPRDERHVVVPADPVAARHARGRRPHDRATERHARRDDVQEASEREAGCEGDDSEGEVHVPTIGRASP